MAQNDTILAGFATADITPAIGMERPANYFKMHTETIHDPVSVRAGVLQHAARTLVFVGLDTIALGREFASDIRCAIEKRLRIPGECVMLAASHAHSGGPLWGQRFVDYENAPSLVRHLALDRSWGESPIYSSWVREQTLTAIEMAHQSLQPSLLSIGTGVEDQVLFNRRFRMRNGRTWTHPGKGNPDIVEPAGPVDPQVGVLGAWDSSGRLQGCIVNYSCHCTTSPGGASADYVQYVEQVIRGVFGRQVEVVFLAGAAGDVTQVDNGSMREREFGERWSRQVGTRVGAEAVKVLASSERGPQLPLGHASKMLTVRRRRPAPEGLEAARATISSDPDPKAPDAAWIFAKETLLADFVADETPAVDVEVQALQVGPAVYLSNPCEYFAESGLSIKTQSPFPVTFVVSLANGCFGYMPPRHAFGPHGGGYETLLTSFSNLEVGTAEAIEEASLSLARELTPGPVLETPRVPAPEEAWTYGTLPPEPGVVRAGGPAGLQTGERLIQRESDG